MKIVNQLKNLHTLFFEFMRYCAVGGIAFICDYSILYVLTEFIGVYYLISTFAGFTVGILINYILSQKWVFKNVKIHGFRPFFTFLIIGIVGLGITEICMWLGVEAANMNYMVIKVLTTAIVLLWNYTARKTLIFSTLLINKQIEHSLD
ncbi:GtrA family protein [Petroclostridium sp. X23]|uniref:GtrA family protein n=1 Tax=Petroclostridium sp. X23 TaxID=3045146 RepID=UPI0024ACC091|nr:GtrA family protein [Petroclostridium sp. X23]WHH60319.1 GtrA family protein [Petroclostridium sp. X23]